MDGELSRAFFFLFLLLLLLFESWFFFLDFLSSCSLNTLYFLRI